VQRFTPEFIEAAGPAPPVDTIWPSDHFAVVAELQQ